LMAVTCQHNDGNSLVPHPLRQARMATGPNKVRRTAQRQLAGETVPAANNVQMPRGAAILLRRDRRPALHSTCGCAADASTVRLTPHVRLASASAGRR